MIDNVKHDAQKQEEQQNNVEFILQKIIFDIEIHSSKLIIATQILRLSLYTFLK